MTDNAERARLADPEAARAWRKWGPYLSERQWGTVREDYSPGGTAWDYLPHDHARSRAYRWGEDGIGGFSDDHQHICLGLALWNERDPILKERLFGLTNSEANHGEDVKELYYYLDATPSHSYMRMLYKYPHAAYPYGELVAENGRRGKNDPEFELIDTGLFNDSRYFDVEIEYAKAAPDDILLRVTAYNRGPEAAPIHLLPQLWFRNIWSWGYECVKPSLARKDGGVRVLHAEGDELALYADGATALYFCENETNGARLFGENVTGYFKDAIHDRVIHGNANAVNPAERGTKVAAHFNATVDAGSSISIRVRLCPPRAAKPFDDFDAVYVARKAEADAFFADLQKGIPDEDERSIQRQALAGMIWSKQYYKYNVRQWLAGDPGQPPPPPQRFNGRNSGWKHLLNADIISMPDKWEYPWYAAWDLAFHTVAMATVDSDYAKHQLLLLTHEWYMHPNGQLPAYEWAFGDVNPPVHAWATWVVFNLERERRGGDGDVAFLERMFLKLLLNFTWWVNRKDRQGNNIFQGGFLGLDNIGVFDRSAPLPTGGELDQSDGTAWVATYALGLMRIALELAQHNPVYEDMATKFFEHFLDIADAVEQIGGDGLWDEEDGFYYDWLKLDTTKFPLRVRSMVGLIPLYAVEVLHADVIERLPKFRKRLQWVLENRGDLAQLVGRSDKKLLLALLTRERMERVLTRMLDESEFLSDYGVRALSRVHRDHPFDLVYEGHDYSVAYAPAESNSGLFGGNSNWRGPIWMPVNFLLITSLRRFHDFYGADFKIECPKGSGRMMNLSQVADELSRRVIALFKRDANGRRPLHGAQNLCQNDPHFRDLVLFYEYFHGDNGRGVGASHQTGWTGLVANLIQFR
jgi:hypothetical protein